MGTEFTKLKIIQGKIKQILDKKKKKQNAVEMQKKELVSLLKETRRFLRGIGVLLSQ